ncbi:MULTISPECIES: DUF1573 domain-containing protein [Amniculibacterium]|jgi:hypothetical protein|uniref:DUF1573 domain-containing protein n=1 Tax=Amniculibacterium TaxID=2715289 RepID=UPI000F5A1A7A|nr:MULTISPECIES: DUF1573 domain-containing protein [Amniculibacterium]
MKKLLAGFAMMGAVAFASAQTIVVDRETYDYGTVKTGSDGHRYFAVKNTGKKPLILSNVKASCGCTTPEWSKDPILPGKTALIKVGYNTASNGFFKKNIEVFSNDPEKSRITLNITGTVDPNAKDIAKVEPYTEKELKHIFKKREAELKNAK